MPIPNIEVCFSPHFLFQHELKGKIVVVADIFRATSCMVTAFAHGVESIIPVAEVEECRDLQISGLLAAAERDGMKVEGFDLDNSPFSYMNEAMKGKTIAITTTNGTQAITQSTEADTIVVGSFLNISSVANYLLETGKSCIILCAGWKGHFNLEDTLFAGALIEKLTESFDIDQDAALSSLVLYQSSKNEIIDLTRKSTHAKRLAKLNIHKDIEFCMTSDKYDVLPIYTNGKLLNVNR
ncbi:MAG: 2-phosphosulfolactate phosphatase [Cytophagales bacterium]